MAGRLVAVLAMAIALMAGAPAAGAATAAGPVARSSLMGTYCGTMPWDYTRARIYAIRVTCAYARSVGRSWLALPLPPGRPAPRIRYVRGFRCVFGGSGGLVKLDCYRGAQVVRARWGD